MDCTNASGTEDGKVLAWFGVQEGQASRICSSSSQAVLRVSKALPSARSCAACTHPLLRAVGCLSRTMHSTAARVHGPQPGGLFSMQKAAFLL